MGHAITIGGLLLSAGALGGLLAFAFGLIAVAAGSMSDAPEAGNAIGTQGCIAVIIGGVVFAACIVGLIH